MIKFYVKLVSIFLLLLIVSISSTYAQSRYWVNGSGEWSDSGHWSETSGGKGGASVPDLSTDVIIDFDSFDEDGEFLTVNGDVYCRSFFWTSTSKSSVFSGNGTIHSSGSIFFKAEIENQFSGNIVLQPTGPANFIESNSAFSCNFLFDGADNVWKLGSDFVTTGDIQFKSGLFCTDGFSMEFNEISRIGNQDLRILFGNSSVKGNSINISELSGLRMEINEANISLADQSGPLQNVENLQSKAFNPAIVISLDKTDPTCNGYCDGSAFITGIVGGTPPYNTWPLTKNWSPNSTTACGAIVGDYTDMITNIGAGTYTVVVYDATGDFNFANIGLIDPPAVTWIPIPTNPLCNGACDGEVFLIMTGGNPPFTFQWDDPLSQTTNPAVGLCEGAYNVTVTDATLPIGCSETDVYDLTAPSGLTVTIDATTDVSCAAANNGAISITAGGGTPGYTYDWSNDGPDAPDDDVEDISGLAGGTYTVTVTDTQGCTGTNSTTISEPATGLSVTEVITHETCDGDCIGAIDLTVSGGTAPYFFTWGGGESSEDLTGLCDGSYDVTVQDSGPGAGCSFTATYVVNPGILITVTETITHESCDGDCDGEVSLVLGGTALGPFSYLWDDPSTQSTNPATSLCPAGYSVTVTDNASSCTTTGGAYTVNPGNAVSLSEVITDATCNGATDGAIDITVADGNPPYTFVWAIDGVGCGLAVNDEDQTTLCAGSYYVTATDADGCTATNNPAKSKVGPTQEKDISAVVVEVQYSNSCGGASNGFVTFNYSGGVPPYVYAWTSDPSGLWDDNLNYRTACPQGYYEMWIGEDNGAGDWTPASINLSELLLSTPVSASYSTTDESGPGACDGAIDLTVSGGTGGPYTFEWSNAASTEDVSALCDGDYTIYTYDTDNCADLKTITVATSGGGGGPGAYVVTEPASITITDIPTGVSCSGGSDGSCDITASGGTAPYTYDWSMDGVESCPGNDVEDPSGLSAGTYTVTVCDANGCTNTHEITITEPAPMSIVHVSTDVSCNGGSDGTANITASDGTAPYTYDWSMDGAEGCPGNDVEDPSGLSAGTYTVTVCDANSCTETEQVIIGEPVAISVAGVITHVTCNGGNNGAIDITASNGTAPYTYDWSMDGAESCPGNDVEDPAGLSAGTYTVTVCDANGCSVVSGDFVINEPLIISVSDLSVDASCNGGSDGSSNITATDGTGPYTYDWIMNGVDGCPGPDAEDPSGLSAGTYTVTVCDANSCTVTHEVTIGEPAAITIASVISGVSCNAGSDGSIAITASNGTAPYTYDWSMDGAEGCPGNDVEDPAGLSAGSYTVTVCDANGCSVASVPLIVGEPLPIGITHTSVDVSCNGGADGSANITVTDGTAPYTFDWSMDGAEGCPGNDVEDPTGLSAGTYTVTVCDANSCTETEQVIIGEPVAMTITEVLSHVTCNSGSNGSIAITVSDGTAPYTFDWSMDGTEGCPGNDVEDPSGLSAGTYTVTVCDANGCTAESLPYTITEPLPVSVAYVVTDVTCNAGSDGSIAITASGGTAPYTYDWSMDGAEGCPGNDTEDPSGLSAGTYTVTVCDANGCTGTQSIIVGEPLVPSVSAVITDVLCNSGTSGAIDITPVNLTGPYSFSWTTADGCGIAAADEDQTGLCEGNYNVTVTDTDGCTGSSGFYVAEPTPISVSEVITPVSCNAGSDGSISITVSGGTGPYTFTWADGTGSGSVAADEDQTGLSAGTYDLTVTDANSCTATYNYSVTEPTAITISEVISDAVCNGSSDGSINITAVDGTAPYTFDWSMDGTEGCPGNDAEDPSGLIAGTYTVTVCDANGCTATKDIAVNEPLAIDITELVTDATCNSDCDGAIDITVVNGVAPFSYSWATANGSGLVIADEDQVGLCAGDYYVTVTDSDGCTGTNNGSKKTLTQAKDISAVVVDVQYSNSCGGGANGFVTFNFSGGIPPYVYAWTSDPSGVWDDNLNYRTACPQGYYEMWIGEDNGSGDWTPASINLAEYLLSTPVSASFAVTDETTAGACDGAVDLTVSGGSGPYTFEWSNAASTEDLSGLCPGDYTIYTYDADHCADVQTATIVAGAAGGSGAFTVGEPQPWGITETISNLLCSGDTDGAIDITVTGNTSPYTYAWSNFETTEDINGLVAGSYTVTITDATTICTTSATYAVTVTNPIAIDTVVTHVDCNGNSTGAINVAVSGGAIPYSFEWSTTATSEDISGLTAGMYTLTVTDANNCTETIEVPVTEPLTPLGATATIVDALCNGDTSGEIDITVTGGTLAYSYSWATAGGSGLSVNAEDQTGLTASTYDVTVTDGNGCTFNDSYPVGQPNVLTSSITDTVHSYCGSLPTVIAGLTFLEDGNSLPEYATSITHSDFPVGLTLSDPAQIQSLCATMEHSYLGDLEIWLECPNGQTTMLKDYPGGDGTFLGEPIDFDCNTSPANPLCDDPGVGYSYCFTAYSPTYSDMVSESAFYSTLPAGSYALDNASQDWDDLVGCPLNGDWTIHVRDNMAIDNGFIFDWTLYFHPSVFPTGYCTGEATVTPVGGVAPYTYQWSGIIATDSSVTDLCAGDYCVTVTDANGCTSESCFTITDTLTYEAAITDSVLITCNGDCNGSATLTPLGGTQPYTYLWDDASAQTDSTAIGLCAGWYHVTLTDGTGCDRVDSVFLVDPAVLDVTLNPTNLNCFGDSDGAIDAVVSGGDTPYTFSWSTVGGSGLVPGDEDQSGLTAGWYFDTIVDDRGCQILDSIELVEPLNILSIGVDSVLNVACNGESSGYIYITVSGGTGPYTYSWVTADGCCITAGADDQTGLGAGTYDLTVTDANSCATTGTWTLTEPVAMTINMLVSDANCQQADGSICAIATNTEGNPSSFIWSDAQTGQCANNLVVGNYCVTVTTSLGCTGTNCAVVGNALAPNIDSIVTSNVTCFGGSDGSAIPYVDTDVTDILTFSWTGPGGFTSVDTAIYNIIAGTYWITVTDQDGCADLDSVVILENNGFTIDTLITDISCAGLTDGSIDLTVTGGVLPYTFVWSGPSGFSSVTEDISGLDAGTYNLTITDGTGICSFQDSYDITAPFSIDISGIVTDVLCHEYTTGEIDVTISGGTLPYTIAWSGGQSSEDLTGLRLGDYTISVSDANGCSNNALFTVAGPDTMLIYTDFIGSNCAMSNGSAWIDSVVGGGSTPLSYLWDTGDIIDTVYNVPVGSYCVTVTTAEGCTNTTCVNVNNIDGPQFSDTTITDVLCFGYSTGAIDVTVSGGTPPYFFSWSNGPISEDISNITAGTYTVTVNDAASCPLFGTFTVAETVILDDNMAVNDITCYGGSNGAINITATGGSQPYSFNWSGTDIVVPTNEDHANLGAGWYYVTITDINSCQKIDSVRLVSPTEILVSDVITNVTCNGDANGAIDITVSGGVSPYSYNWAHGPVISDLSGLAGGWYYITVTDDSLCTAIDSFEIAEPVPFIIYVSQVNSNCAQTNGVARVDSVTGGGTMPYTYLWNDSSTEDTLAGIAAGTYTVTVSSQEGCSSTAQFSIIDVDGPQVDTIIVSPVTCYGYSDASLDLQVSGGTLPYSFVWSNSAVIEDPAGLSAGTYTVTITDDQGCIGGDSAIVVQPDSIEMIFAVTDLSCYNDLSGAIDLSVSGGTGAYTFDWDNLAISEDITGLSAGWYTVTITDANLCTNLDSANVAEPIELLASIVGTDPACAGYSTGMADLTVSGGTAPYTYSWNGGDSSEDLNNIPAGTYTVTVTDANTCSVVSSIIINDAAGFDIYVTTTQSHCGMSDGSATLDSIVGATVFDVEWTDNGLNVIDSDSTLGSVSNGDYWVYVTVNGGCYDSLEVTINNQDGPQIDLADVTMVACNNETTGAIDLTVSGGTSPYTFNWTTIDGCNIASASEDQSGLCAGEYNVTITDASTCTNTWDTLIVQPDPFIISVSVTDVTCYGLINGEIDMEISGGVSPYTYSWAEVTETTQDISGLAAGSYHVTITDANLCDTAIVIDINGPSEIVSDIVVNSGTCSGAGDASVDLTVSGGTVSGDYVYEWSNGATTQDLSNLYADTLFVTITDDNLCFVIDTAIVDSVLAIQITEVAYDSSNCGICDGRVELAAIQGTSPYSFAWSNGGTDPIQDTLCGGNTYTVTVTDLSGCTATTLVMMSDAFGGVLDIARTNNDCYGYSMGTATANMSGGSTPYSYEWSTTEITPTILNLQADTFYITITDADNCKLLDSVIITQPDEIVPVLNASDIICNAETTGSVDLEVSGGTVSADYSYSWSNAALVQDISNLSAGTYTVTVTDDNLCTATGDAVIAEPAALTFDNITAVNNLCNSVCEGTVTVVASGGTGVIDFFLNDGAADYLDDPALFIDSLCGGWYVPRIEDENGCTLVGDTITITEPMPFDIYVSTTQSNCQQSNGTATVDSVVGHTGSLAYLWSNNETVSSITVGSGYYEVSVSDDLCTYVEPAPVSDVDGPQIDSVNFTNVLPCNSDQSGTISMYATGTSDLVYQLNGGTWEANNGLFAGLDAGTYIVMVKDTAGCLSDTTIEISEPDVLMVQGIAVNDISDCYGNCNGSIEIDAIGGTGTYYYSIDNGGAWQIGNSVFNNLCAGTYDVIVEDVYGCRADAGAVSITQPSPILILPDPVSHTDLTCFESANGSITVLASGGTGVLGYSIDGGNTFSANNGLFTGLEADTYDIEVVDGNGCTVTGMPVTIIQPAEIAISMAVDSSDCGLSNGRACLTVTGGTTPYTYLWETGQDTSCVDTLAGGNYLVYVTDNNSCLDSAVVSVSDAGAGQLVFADTNHVDCYGNSNGSVSILVVNGNPPHSYLWNTGATDTLLTNLAGGLYSVEATDNVGCVLAGNVEIIEPDDFNIDIDKQDILCSGETSGSIDLTVTGATPGYSYNWNDLFTTEDLDALATGQYIVTVTDANGCTTDTSIMIVEPVALSANIVGSNVNCNGGSTGGVLAIPSGGTAPYSFLWSTGDITASVNNLQADTFYVTVSDANGCSVVGSVDITEPGNMLILTDSDSSSCGSCNGAVAVINVVGGGGDGITYFYEWNTDGVAGADVFSAGAQNLCAGNYPVTVTNSDGCKDSVYVSVSDINGPEISGFDVTDVLCYGGSTGAVCVNATTPFPNLSYNWNEGSTTDCISGLTAGVYLVTVTDGLGCIAASFDTISEPEEILLQFAITDAICPSGSDGLVSLSISGGTPSYTILWSNDSITANIQNLASMDYIVTVTDALGCTVSDTAFVNDPDPIFANPVTTDALCFGYCDGTATIAPTGGTAPFALEWFDGTTASSVENLCAGFYNVTITDDAGCEAVATISIGEPCPLTGMFTDSTLVACGGDSTGTVTITPNCGTPPYSYSWDDYLSQNTPTADSLYAFIYHVTITDANGCSYTDGFEVKDTSSLSLTLVDSSSISCFGLCDGFVIVSASGGMQPYSFNWYENVTTLVDVNNSGATIDSLINLCEASYIAQVVDDSLCSRAIEIPIIEPDVLLAYIADSSLVSCSDTCNGSLTAGVIGGTAPYLYSWSNGITDSLVTGLCPESVIVLTVTDSKGCSSSVEDSLAAPVPISVLYDSIVATTCSRNSYDGGIWPVVAGGAGSYTYLWSNGDTTLSIFNLESGVYHVTITDSLNCTLRDSATVAPGLDVRAVALDNNIICYGDTIRIVGDSSINANYFAWAPAELFIDTTVNNPEISPLADATIILHVMDLASGCQDWDTITIEVLPVPIVDAGADITLHPDEIDYLDGYCDDADGIYQWVPDNGLSDATTISPQVEAIITTVYYLQVTGSNGCRASDSVTVNVIPKIMVPSGFTPNADGDNDVWEISFIENYQTKVLIYNRWGKLLYETESYNGNEWDGTFNGKELPEGTYYYIIEIYNSEIETEPITGPVTIIR